MVSYIAFDGSGAMVGVPTWARVSWAILLRHTLMRRYTNFALGRPLTVRMFEVDQARWGWVVGVGQPIRTQGSVNLEI